MQLHGHCEVCDLRSFDSEITLQEVSDATLEGYPIPTATDRKLISCLSSGDVRPDDFHYLGTAQLQQLAADCSVHMQGTELDHVKGSCESDGEASTVASSGEGSPNIESVADEIQSSTPHSAVEERIAMPEVFVPSTLLRLIPPPPGLEPPPPPEARTSPLMPMTSDSVATNFATLMHPIPPPPTFAPPPQPIQMPAPQPPAPVSNTIVSSSHSSISDNLLAEVHRMVEQVEIAIAGGFSRQGNISCFDAKSIPKVSIATYLDRLCRYARFSNESLVLSLIFLDRIAKANGRVVLSQKTCHSLLFTSLMVAYKYHDGYDDKDFVGGLGFWGRLGGFRPQKVARLEREFVSLLKWRLFASPEEYDRFEALICQ